MKKKAIIVQASQCDFPLGFSPFSCLAVVAAQEGRDVAMAQRSSNGLIIDTPLSLHGPETNFEKKQRVFV